MKHFKLTFFLTVLMSMVGAKTFAHDIKVANSDGVNIYYKWINNNTELSVTYLGQQGDSYNNEYSGNVVIPESVTYKGKTYSVTSIGDHAFSICSELTSVTIPNSVTSIGDIAFHKCSGLTSIVIPNSVTSIGGFAFSGCSSLTSITIPNGVTSILADTFEECRSLTSVNIPDGVTSIGSGAFYKCSGLNSIVIPNSVTSIGDHAFYYCSGLTSVTIPNNVTSIGESAFYMCSKLTSVIINSNTIVFSFKMKDIFSGNVKEYIIGEGVTSIGECAFSSCSGVTSVTIPNSVTSIGNSAFSNCSKLTSVTIPNSVTRIGDGTFSGCSSLRSITIGKSVTSIVYDAFGSCSMLVSVTVLNPTPITINQDLFPNRNNATLYVPKGSESAYKAANYWKEFKEIKNIPLPTHKLIYLVDGEEYKVYEVKEEDPISPEPEPTKEGFTFSGWSEIPVTMPDHDVIVTGTFTINTYKLTYMVDGETYKTLNVKYAETITPEADPTREGYTFSGWSEIPETMPAKDVTITGTFAINTYKLTYMVDNEVYKTFDVKYAETITPEAEPTKEGYTFGGWSEIPETMPAKDVTITGSFAINTYKLTYMVDGEIYKTLNVKYAETITPEAEPTREGYTFSGWSKIPETMPAKDVTILGTFKTNKYKVSYYVDNNPYYTNMVDYGATIIPPTVPEREGFEFAWGYIPDTMPAYDISVYGKYTTKTGISQPVIDKNSDVNIYSLDGRHIESTKKGLYIIRTTDRKIRKVVLK